MKGCILSPVVTLLPCTSNPWLLLLDQRALSHQPPPPLMFIYRFDSTASSATLRSPSSHTEVHVASWKLFSTPCPRCMGLESECKFQMESLGTIQSSHTSLGSQAGPRPNNKAGKKCARGLLQEALTNIHVR